MRILLVACYELGHQPFNLASPAAHLIAAGFRVDCLDISVQPLSEQLVKQADLIAISTPMHTALQMAIRLAEQMRALNEHAHICFYGLYAGLHSRFLLSKSNIIDSAVGGEFETVLVKLARQLSHGSSPDDSDSVVGRQTGTTWLGRQSFLPPERTLLPSLEHYSQLDYGGEKQLVGATQASRGCAHRCLHCPGTPVYNGRLRIIAPEVVHADITKLISMGARHITFEDPDFLNGIKHSLAIVRTLHEDFPEITYDFTTKIEHILFYRDLLPEFRRTGCLFVVSAIELLNNVILKVLLKGHTRADVFATVAIMRDTGLYLRPSLLPFTPWTARKDFQDLFVFLEAYDLVEEIDLIQLTIRLLLPPGSALLQEPRVMRHVTEFDQAQLCYRWRHPVPDIDALQQACSRELQSGLRRDEPRTQIYRRLRDLAFQGDPSATPWRDPGTSRTKTPRLTEDWFC
jgi:radical SAM superfamily enzyme YgiQ (UPF0313 family)